MAVQLRARILVWMLTLVSASIADAPQARAEAFSGVIAPGDQRCGGGRSGLCEAWRLKWAHSGEVAALVETQTAVPLVAPKGWTIDHDDGGLRHTLRRKVEAGQEVRLLVWVLRERGETPYTLQFTPPPQVLAKPGPQKAPKSRRDWDRKRQERMTKPPQSSFMRSRKVFREHLQALRRGGSKFVSAKKGKLETFNGWDVQVEAGYCYTFVVKLGRAGRWSELALRGLSRRYVGPDGKNGNFFLNTYRDAATFGLICSNVSGTGYLRAAIDFDAAAPYAFDLGVGPYTLEIWRRPGDPYRYDATDLAMQVKEHTNGMRMAQIVAKGNLAKLEPIHVDLKEGSCYTFVLQLGKGAKWSDHTLKASNITFELELPGMDISAGPGARGPGAVGDAGCIFASARARLEVRTVGTGKNPEALGTGPAVLEMWTRKAPKPEMRRLIKELKRDGIDVRDYRDAAFDGTCKRCAQEREVCLKGRGKACQNGFVRCVGRLGYRASACGF